MPVVDSREVIHCGLCSILDMEQRPKLISAKHANLTILPGPNGESIDDQIQPDPRKFISDAKKRAQSKRDGVRIREDRSPPPAYLPHTLKEEPLASLR